MPWATNADIIHIHFWNTPEMYSLLEAELPPGRILLTCHVGGRHAPQVLTPEIIEFADAILLASPELLQQANPFLKEKALYAPPGADLERVRTVAPQAHSHFNIGYIGTIDFGKMHPHYVPMHVAINLPEARIIICGGGAALPTVTQQIKNSGAAYRFDIRGYVGDIAPILSIIDVFGYPLCEDNYSGSELVLQEVMAVGIPSVVFAHGGARYLIDDGETGFIVKTEAEYVDRICFLHDHRDERLKMGAAAAAYARLNLGAENLAPAIERKYEQLAATPRRKHAPMPCLRGAEAFIRSLGDSGGIFKSSMSSDLDSAMAADRRIAASSPGVASASGGGILHYRRYYPTDPILRLWAGLVLAGQGRPALAAAEFKAAVGLGYSDGRAALYLSRAIEEARKGKTFRK